MIYNYWDSLGRIHHSSCLIIYELFLGWATNYEEVPEEQPNRSIYRSLEQPKSSICFNLWTSMSSSASSSSSSTSSSSSSSASASAAASSSSSSGSASSSAGGSASSSSSGGISSRTIVAIATSTVIGVILLILIVLLIIKFIRKNIMKESTASDSIIKEFFQSLSTESPKRFTSKELIGITSNYAKELGAGGFGRVYEGKMKLPKNSQMLVAVKVLNSSINSSVEEQFIAEVGTMWRTNHINLVKLYGFCFDAKMKALVYEYMENGSLDAFLSGKKGWLEMDKLHEISVGTAKGIRYLHEECHKMIIHFDIKPGNVLLTKDLCAKVGDFGLAELSDRETTIPLITHGRGTPGFSAPELLAFNFTHKSDVYSFGMLLFEIVGSRRIKDGKQGERDDSFPRWVWDNISNGEVGRIVSECEIAEKYSTKAERMCRVALMCIRHQPDTRPSMSSVLKMLEGEEEIGATVNPFNSLVSSVSDPKSEMSVGDYQPSETSS